MSTQIAALKKVFRIIVLDRVIASLKNNAYYQYTQIIIWQYACCPSYIENERYFY